MRKSQFAVFRVSLLLFCILASFAVAAWLRSAGEEHAFREFHTITEDSQQALEARMQNYHLALEGLKGLLNASQRLTAVEMRAYVDSISLDEALPGVNGIGYIVPVRDEDIESFLAKAARDGFPLDRIHPQTDSAEHFVIKIIEPLERNAEAAGLDISFEETRRKAAIAARDSGETRLTGRILLVQDETRQPGFLLLVPHYANGLPTDTMEERRDAFRGWVYAPFVGALTLADLSQSEGSLFGLQVFDGPPLADNLIFDSSQDHALPDNSLYTREAAVPLFGRTWTVRWYSLPPFEQTYRSHLDAIALAVGFIFTAVLGDMLWRLQSRNTEVQNLVLEKTRELKSRVSENESVIDNALVGIVILDADGHVLSSNASARKTLRLPDDWPPGADFSQVLILPEDAGTTARIKYQHPQQPERFSYIDVNANTWQTAEGALRTTVILQDSTEAELAAEKIAKTEERLDLALKGSEIGVFDIDLLAGTSVVSETWRKIMGVQDRPETFDTQAFFMSRIHPEDLQKLIAADRACITGRAERSTTEFRMQLDTGQRWMRSDAAVVARDEDGLALRMLGTQTDITEFRQAQAALKASEDRFRQTFQSAPVGKAILDRDFTFLSVNAAMCDLAGYEREELEGARTPEVLLKPTDWEVLRETLFAMSGEHRNAYRQEFEILRPDGRSGWCLGNANAGIDPKTGEPIYILQMLDITETKQMQRMKSEFVASVSHELRTPLTSIKGAISLLQSGREKMASTSLRLLDIAMSNVDRLTELVNDILDLEKIQSGNMTFDFADRPAAEILATARDQIMPLAQQVQVGIDLHPLPADILVRVDASRMIQVLTNLLSNACKFSPAGQSVTMIAETEKGFLRIAVRDHGPGVPEAFLPKLFQPFSQADSSDTREKGGTGLGLSIAAEMVHRLGGEIGHRRLPDGQTEFWFTCRLSRRETEEPEAVRRAG